MEVGPGLVVSTLDFQSGGQRFKPSLVVALDKKLYRTLCLFTKVYKCVPLNIMLGGYLVMDWHPNQREVAIIMVFPVV